MNLLPRFVFSRLVLVLVLLGGLIIAQLLSFAVHIHDRGELIAQATASWPYRLLISIALLLTAVVLVSLIAVRWAIRPLNTLAEAAEELGKNINRPPLQESGPFEVVRAARAFNTMQSRLAGYLRDRTRVLAAMSHDLKTPITRLRLRSELLDDAQKCSSLSIV